MAHGEWTDFMESHYRFHNAAMSIARGGDRAATRRDDAGGAGEGRIARLRGSDQHRHRPVVSARFA